MNIPIRVWLAIPFLFIGCYLLKWGCYIGGEPISTIDVDGQEIFPIVW